jgi:hypothetical protein
MVRYRWGGLKILVRFEIDACLPGDWTSGAERDIAQLLGDLSVGDTSTGDHAKTLSTDPDPSKTVPPRDEGPEALNVLHRSDPAVQPSQESLLELKARKWTRAHNPLETFAQLAFSQTPHLDVGRHKEGDFGLEPLEIVDLEGSEMQNVAKDQEVIWGEWLSCCREW